MAQATEKQTDCLSMLFIDCGFTHIQRKSWLQNRFGREVFFLDDLTSKEASQAITELRELKERGRK